MQIKISDIGSVAEYEPESSKSVPSTHPNKVFGCVTSSPINETSGHRSAICLCNSCNEELITTDCNCNCKLTSVIWLAYTT